jgi:hypothetical protein
MKVKLFVLCIFLSVSPLFSQSLSVTREDIWVTSVAEANFFSVSGMAFGGGAALGYGDGVSVGLRVVYFIDMKSVTNEDSVKTLEFNFLLRFYLPRLTGHSGPFIQFNGGPVLFAKDDRNMAMPSDLGTFSAGLCLGWRLLIGNYFYLEPTVRTGYPYFFGIGLSAGGRF